MNSIKKSKNVVLGVIIVFLFGLVFSSCISDEDDTPISLQNQDEIKSWYESSGADYLKIKRLPYWNSRIHSNFPDSEKKIQWDKRIEYTFASGRKAKEYQLEFEEDNFVINSGVKFSQKSASVVFVESRSGYLMYTLKYYDDSKDSKTSGIEYYSLRNSPENFSGLLTLSTFDDKILATYLYEDGKYISRGSVKLNREEKKQNKSNASQICFDVEVEFSVFTPIGTTVEEGGEITSYTEIITFCMTSHSPGGGDPGTGNGSPGDGSDNGDSGGNPAEWEMDLGESFVYFDDHIIEDPCLHASGLANDDNFRSNFLGLKNSINSNYEAYGLLVRNSLGLYEYGLGRGLYNVSSVNINPEMPIDGYIHSHYQGLYPIFSVSDINAIYQLHESNLLANGLESFFIGVITEHTAYILKIEDEVAFLNFANLNFGSQASFNALETYFNNWVGVNKALGLNDIQSYEIAFLKALEGAGIVLFKGDNNSLDSWEKRILNNQGQSINGGC